ncbi:MAG: hypothetical protein K1X72_03545 [Pyrinomonadaceae bacterium]|nr:hypothetical protein [Pyrinomonadaceae bacterium]
MKKMNLIVGTMFVIFTVASALFAQLNPSGLGKVKDPIDVKAEREKLPTLGCCKCLEGSNTLDLSTIQGNNWTVNGSPVAFPTSIHGAWNLNIGSAKWVSTNINGSIGNVPQGDYEYKLQFFIPNCTIGQEVKLAGNLGADDDVKFYLDNTSSTPLSQCGGGWCFNTQNSPPAFSTTITTPGIHTLIVQVHNSGLTPSGMFMNAKLVSKCSTKLTKGEK